MKNEPANNRQVDGEHYKDEYQHWDFVCDTNLHYLLGCATKYVYRWRNKNGVQDLKKAIHYLEKAKERHIYGIHRTYERKAVTKFTKQIRPLDGKVILLICCEYYDEAIKLIKDLIEIHNACEPTSHYIRG